MVFETLKLFEGIQVRILVVKSNLQNEINLVILIPIKETYDLLQDHLIKIIGTYLCGYFILQLIYAYIYQTPIDISKNLSNLT